MKRGFTLIELVVAVALLSMVLSFAGLIFNVSIDSHRTAKANAEIMRNLRAITDQLNTDFAGIQTDAPLLIWFQKDNGIDPNRYDQIMFFANGDVQSIQLYEDAEPDWEEGDRTISGNISRIHYGQAQMYSWTEGRPVEPWEQIYGRHPEDTVLEKRQRALARRQHILTADGSLNRWPDVNDVNGSFDDESKWDMYKNECYEHDRLGAGEWKRMDAGVYDTVVEVCFDYRPLIDMDNPEDTFHKLMCQGVGSFAIQWAYWDDDEERFLWFPSDDPDGDGDDDDSHFRPALMGEEFGVYFNVPNGSDFDGWYFIGETNVRYGSGDEFSADFYPKALKFTFRLYDSKGLIEQDGEKGREFTHIVYLGG